MAYEKRKSGVYYYQKKRVNGKVVSIYLGKGLEAEAAHAKIQKAKQCRAELNEMTALHEPNRVSCDDVDRVMDLFYLAHGCHYVNGRWRKRNSRTLTPDVIAEIERYAVVYKRLDAALRAKRLAAKVQNRSGDETNYGVTIARSTTSGMGFQPMRVTAILAVSSPTFPNPNHPNKSEQTPRNARSKPQIGTNLEFAAQPNVVCS